MPTNVLLCQTVHNKMCTEALPKELQDLRRLDRSSRSQMLFEIGVLKISQNSQENTSVRVSILIKL